MINVTWDKSFKHTYQKKIKSDTILKNKFWETLKLFIKDPFNPKIRTHKLYGKLKGHLAFSVTYDCRVVFKFISKKEALLIDIGGHEEVY